MVTLGREVPSGRQVDPSRYAYCKLCTFSIKEEDERVWLSNPTGLSHTKCAKKKGYIK